MKPRLVSVSIALALSSVAMPLVAQDAVLERARLLLSNVPLIDGHNDLPWTLRESFAGDLSRVDLRARGATVDTDIPRLREGLVSAQFWSVFIPSGLSNPARTQIELARRMIDAVLRSHFQPVGWANLHNAAGRLSFQREHGSSWREQPNEPPRNPARTSRSAARGTPRQGGPLDPVTLQLRDGRPLYSVRS